MKNKIVYLIGTLIILIILAAIIYLDSKAKPLIFKVENRINDIEKEQKKEDNKTCYNTIGWLKVQGTNIDIKVINHDNGSCIISSEENYAWEINKEGKFYNVTNIQGHNILNLSSKPLINQEYFVRFDDLMSYSYIEFAKENKYIQYTIEGKNHIYKIFAVYIGHNDLTQFDNSNYNKKTREKIITTAKNNSIYKYDIDVNGNDNLLTLETCTRMFGGYDKSQMYVIAREIREGEYLTNYNVKETSKYKKIKKTMNKYDDGKEA